MKRIGLLLVAVLAMGIAVPGCDGDEEDQTYTPLTDATTPTAPSTTNEFTSDDGRVTFVLDNVDRSKVWPAELRGGHTPKTGYGFVIVYVTIASITDGHLTIGKSDSTIIDGNGVEYDDVALFWKLVKFQDPTDVNSSYELIEGSQATLIFELPENAIAVKVKLNYLFFSSWSQSGQYVSEEERYMDIILP